MAKNRLQSKQKNSVQRMKQDQELISPAAPLVEQVILDLVMKHLYNDPEKEVMHLEEEIYKPNNIVLPKKVAERVWESLKSSGMVAPLIGFGNSGKVELTNAGQQVMSQFGGYANFLHMQNPTVNKTTTAINLTVKPDDQSSEIKA